MSLRGGWFPALGRELLGDEADVLLRHGRGPAGRLAHTWRMECEPEE
ncbi:hypothetical protein [Streptomyces misionensis]|nr:hypothetical protein [Streptomyces misionensis]